MAQVFAKNPKDVDQSISLRVIVVSFRDCDFGVIGVHLFLRLQRGNEASHGTSGVLCLEFQEGEILPEGFHSFLDGLPHPRLVIGDIGPAVLLPFVRFIVLGQCASLNMNSSINFIHLLRRPNQGNLYLRCVALPSS